MSFSIKQRQEMLEEMQQTPLDVLIIGGGITGAGLALQTAASGIKTGLLEMQDFAEGTSSRSTKLVHGGIRYLKTFDVEVVSDTVSERAVLQQIAPHIPKADPMLLPIYDDEGTTTFDMFSVKVAMDLYDQLANVTGSEYANYTLTKEEVLEREPYLKSEGLQGAGVYLDYRNNDARLVIDNIKQAVADGALAVSKVKVTGFLYNEDQIIGVKARDELTGQTIEIKATYVVNTTGPWVDKIRQLNFKRAVVPQMRPTKGVHLVIDSKRLPVPQPTYFDTGKQDGRMVFAIPRENKTYFGTTDTDYTGDYAHPEITQKDVDYLLEVINYRYPKANITLADVESSWVGLRPLLSDNSGSDYNGGDNGSISDRSFQKVLDAVSEFKSDQMTRSDVERVLKNLEMNRAEKAPSTVSRGSKLEREADGLITLAGGKITDYRKMALGALNLLCELFETNQHRTIEIVDSANYPVSGGDFDATQVKSEIDRLAQIGIKKGLPEEQAHYIADFYGTNAKTVFSYITQQPLFKTADLSLAEAISLYYGLEHEMVLTPADYLVRRTNHLWFQRETLDEVKHPIIEAMAEYFEWETETKNCYTMELQQTIDESDLIHLKKEGN
ncbi:type 1 glycerol-3-phosphate oxidase [Enterococcus bulliens]